MKKSELKGVLESSGVNPCKKLGQNFLVDDNFLDCLVRDAAIRPGERILEVGPGFGALTGRMLEAGAEVAAIEFDRRICRWLEANLVPKGLRLIEGDACRVDFSSIFGPEVPFRFIANLPYSAGTVVVAKLLELECLPTEIIIMLQREVAMRLAAQPGTHEYGSLSVRAQTAYDIHQSRGAPPELFHPKPDVESSIVRMRLRALIPGHAVRLNLAKTAKLGFSHRRKKMFKQLASLFGTEKVREAYREAGIDLDIRAERVGVAEFLKLSEALARD